MTTTTPTGLTAPARPVTPGEHLASLLSRLGSRVDDGSLDLPDDARRDLLLARDLAVGLDAYADRVTSPASPSLVALEQTTRSADWAGLRDRVGDAAPAWEQEMLSGPAEGELLALLVHVTRARRVLEIGMFTGYATLAMAEALPDDGQVVACELDADVADVAGAAFADSPAGRRIDVRVGPAADTLAALRDQRSEAFDLVFVDADKAGYRGYVEAVLDGGLLAPHGVLAVDNTLMQGEPWLTPDASRHLASGGAENGRAIADFNDWLAAEPRLRQVLVPLRDGVTLARLADPAAP